MKNTALLVLISFTLSVSAYAQYPDININRPRIYADSSRLEWLQNNIMIAGECQNTYTNFIYAYNNWWINDPQLYLLGSDSTQWTWDWSSPWAGSEAFYTVFIFKITNDPLALKRCRFISEQVISYIASANFTSMEWYTKENLLRQMSDAGDILLDWCYDDLPHELRDQLTRSLYAMNREFMNTFILSVSGTSYVSSHNTWNTIFCNQNALTLYEASGLSPLQKDTVVQWYRAVYDKLINGFIPCWSYYRDDDGGWNWGAAYAMWSLTDQYQLFENMRIGTTKDFYSDLSWVKNSINQYIYFIQPNNKCIHLGDGETSLSGDRVMYLHARIFNNPRSLWLAQYWSQPEYTPNTNQKFAKLLYKDFTMPVVSKPDPPLDWWADKVGLSVSRSSWNEDATMVTFFNSPSKRAAHEHRDNNSFTIFKNAPLLLDAGYYDTYNGTHYRNYYQRTIAHNSICVFDSTDNYSCFGQASSNDGGQIESSALMNYTDIFLPENQRGTWIKYASGSNYTYNISDAQLSYDPAKLDFFRRRLLFIKPGQVIVLDHIHLKNTASGQRKVKWTAHFARSPKVNGNVVNTQVPGHVVTFNGKDYSATNGSGKIAIRTILPAGTTTTLIGGTGYEYWVDGINYPPLVSPDTSYYTPGRWRIEVIPQLVTDTVVYLHTIVVGDSNDLVSCGGSALSSAFSVGTDWNNTLYFFAADAGTAKDYHRFNQVAGGRFVNIFALDMLPGAYYILIDGVNSGTAFTDSCGILQSSIALSSGNHAVEIVSFNSSFVKNAVSNPVSIYPNPARYEINVDLKTGLDAFDIEIYSSTGVLQSIFSNKSKLNIAGLSPGVYILKVKQGGRIFYGNFVKE